MEMDFTFFVCLNNIARQQILFGIVFSYNTRQQVTLSRDDFTVFIGVFIQQFSIGLLDQPLDSLS